MKFLPVTSLRELVAIRRLFVPRKKRATQGTFTFSPYSIIVLVCRICIYFAVRVVRTFLSYGNFRFELLSPKRRRNYCHQKKFKLIVIEAISEI